MLNVNMLFDMKFV